MDTYENGISISCASTQQQSFQTRSSKLVQDMNMVVDDVRDKTGRIHVRIHNRVMFRVARSTCEQLNKSYCN